MISARRRIHGLLACAATALYFASASAAQVPAEDAAPAADETPEEPVETAWVTPTTFDRIGRVMAPVYINGEGPFRFIIDTGASSSAIAPRVADRLGLVPDKDKLLSLRGTTGAGQVPSILVERLQAGELVLTGQRLPVIDSGVFANADGILGVDGFKGMCLWAMFWHNRVSILRNGCPRIRLDWPRVPAKVKFGHLITVRARIGRTYVSAIIDTGAQRTLGNLALLRALGLEDEAGDERSLTRVTGATEHTVEGNFVRSPRISLGEVNIANLHVTFGDFEVFRLWDLEDQPSMLLGMDVLGTVDGLMIDYKRREVRFLPSGSGGWILKIDRDGTRLPGS